MNNECTAALDNLIKLKMQEAKIIIDLIPEYYKEPLYCGYSSCRVKTLAEHYHIDEHTLTFNKLE